MDDLRNSGYIQSSSINSWHSAYLNWLETNTTVPYIADYFGYSLTGKRSDILLHFYYYCFFLFFIIIYYYCYLLLLLFIIIIVIVYYCYLLLLLFIVIYYYYLEC